MMILNPYRYASGGGLAYATWNPSDKAADVTLAGGNLTSYNGSGADGHDLVRATLGKNSGKWYFEVSSQQDRGTTPADGLMVGLTTAAQTLAGNYPGQIANTFGVLYRRYNNASNAVEYYVGGASTITTVVPSLASGWIGVAYNAAYGAWVIVDGTWVGGKSPSSHPTSPLFSLPANTYYPAASHYWRKATYADMEQVANFGASGFSIGSVFGTGQVLDGFNQGWHA